MGIETRIKIPSLFGCGNISDKHSNDTSGICDGQLRINFEISLAAVADKEEFPFREVPHDLL